MNTNKGADIIALSPFLQFVLFKEYLQKGKQSLGIRLANVCLVKNTLIYIFIIDVSSTSFVSAFGTILTLIWHPTIIKGDVDYILRLPEEVAARFSNSKSGPIWLYLTSKERGDLPLSKKPNKSSVRSKLAELERF